MQAVSCDLAFLIAERNRFAFSSVDSALETRSISNFCDLGLINDSTKTVSLSRMRVVSSFLFLHFGVVLGFVVLELLLRFFGGILQL